MSIFSNVKDAQVSLYSMIEDVEQALDGANVSLSQFVKSKCYVLHRMFIQRELAAEPVLSDIIVNVQNMIAAWALCAVQLSSVVDGAKTAGKMLEVIGTEGYEPETMQTLLESFAGLYDTPGLQAALDSFHKAERSLLPGMEEAEAEPQSDDDKKKKDEQRNDKGSPSGAAKFIDIPSSTRLPVGKVVNVEMRVRNSSEKLLLPVLIQVNPVFIPANVMEQFIAVNFKPGFLQRWIQLTTKEISFFKDFIAESDRRSKRRKAMKTHGPLMKELQDAKDNASSKFFKKLLNFKAGRQNIANSILVVDEYEFKKQCDSNGINFSRQDQRQKFFDSVFALMLVTVDTNHDSVTFYYNGIDGSSTFSVNQLKNNAKTDNFGVIDIMKSIVANQPPRF